jgi:PAS domain S-box-containing protein
VPASDDIARALLEQIPAITYTELPGASRAYTYVSPQVEAVLGYSPAEIAACPGLIASRIHPDDRDRVAAEDRRTTRTGEPFHAEYRVETRDGRWVWLRNEAVLVCDAAGRPLHWQGVVTDITAQREAETALRESEQRFRALVQHGYDIITVVAPDGSRRYVSPSIEHVLGYPPEALVGGNALDLIHPDDVPHLRAAIDGCCAGASRTPPLELRFRHRDGEWREFEAVGTNLLDDPAVAGVVFTSREVTARNAAESARRESEEQFRSLFERAGIATAVADGDGVFQLANPALGAFLGYDVAELVGMTNAAITHPEDNAKQHALRDRMWAGELDSYALEKRYLRRDGSVVWGALHTTAIRDADGAVVGALGQIEDITDRKAAETALRESEARFRAAFDHAPTGFAIIAADGTFHQVNHALCDLLGYAEHELLGRSFLDITHPDDLADELALTERLWTGAIPSYQMEKRCLHKDGHAVWTQLTTSAVRDAGGGPYAIAQIQDVTDQRHLEMERAIMLASEREYTRQLRDLSGLRSDLSALVAHELNTPIAAVKMLAQMLATKELSPAEEARTFAAIYDQIDQLDRLAADVAAAAAAERDDFAVQLHPAPVTVLLGSAAASARTTLADHPLTVRPAPDVRVWCDPERIGQVLHNLLGNAAKHTPAGTPVALRTWRDGEWMRFEVSDAGPGIAPEDQRLIFEKFGRSRETASRGTLGAGLGLYLARGIVEAHGSELTVSSRPGQGTTFAFSLRVAP